MSKYLQYSAYLPSDIWHLSHKPAHWSIAQLKRVVDGCVNGIWGSEPDGNDDTVVIRVADFDRARLSIKGSGYTYRKISDAEKTRRKLKKGDLLLEKSGGGDKTLVGQVVLFDIDCDAVTSNFVAKMSTKSGFDSRFLNYVFARFYNERINYCSIKQNTGIQNLDSEQYLSEHFVFPCSNEQQKIAVFLDHETAKIDTLIEKQQQLIKLLKEKRQAVISHAVTKGQNPDAPMKDSGVEWLGEVPEHWKVGYIKQFSKIESGHTPDKKKEEYWIDCDIPWVSLNDSKKLKVLDYIEDTKYKVNNLGIKNSSARILPEDAVVFTRDASIGLSAITKRPMAVSQHIIAWLCNSKALIPEFLLLVFYAMSDEFERYTFGATIKTIGMDDVKSLRAAIPPLNEQQKITNYVFEKKKKIDTSIEKAEQFITLLQERRQALISAAVTGKIDVRNWQPRSSADMLQKTTTEPVATPAAH